MIFKYASWVIGLNVLCQVVSAQDSLAGHRAGLLSGGIYVDNLGKRVMLGIEYSNIPRYERSKIIFNKKYAVTVQWDSVKIFQKFVGSLHLTFQPNRDSLQRGRWLWNIGIAFDSSLARDLRKFLEQYTGVQGEYKSTHWFFKKYSRYRWTIDECLVGLYLAPKDKRVTLHIIKKDDPRKLPF
jgi:hypothetical protein